MRPGQTCEIGITLFAIGLQGRQQRSLRIEPRRLGRSSRHRTCKSSIQRTPGVISSNRSRAESSPPGGMSEARTVACFPFGRNSPARCDEHTACQPIPPRSRREPWNQAADARKKTWNIQAGLDIRYEWLTDHRSPEPQAPSAAGSRDPGADSHASIAIVLDPAIFSSNRQPVGSTGEAASRMRLFRVPNWIALRRSRLATGDRLERLAQNPDSAVRPTSLPAHG